MPQLLWTAAAERRDVNTSDPFGLCPGWVWGNDGANCDYNGDGKTSASEIAAYKVAHASNAVSRTFWNVIGVFNTMLEGPGNGGFVGARSQNWRPPTNQPQNPPTDIPDGWRVRKMPPNTDYPNGYWKLEKPLQDGHWQPIDPSTMRPGGHPETHVEFPPGSPEIPKLPEILPPDILPR
jgi:hypothetical protein